MARQVAHETALAQNQAQKIAQKLTGKVAQNQAQKLTGKVAQNQAQNLTHDIAQKPARQTAQIRIWLVAGEEINQDFLARPTRQKSHASQPRQTHHTRRATQIFQPRRATQIFQPRRAIPARQNFIKIPQIQTANSHFDFGEFLPHAATTAPAAARRCA